jgi:hypothetical protein
LSEVAEAVTTCLLSLQEMRMLMNKKIGIDLFIKRNLSVGITRGTKDVQRARRFSVLNVWRFYLNNRIGNKNTTFRVGPTLKKITFSSSLQRTKAEE